MLPDPQILPRHIRARARQSMEIFWGDYSAAKSSAVEGWQVYSFQRGAEKESFSQVLFRALGLPEVRGDFDSNITMHQLLRVIYVDQLSPVDLLMRYEAFDSPLTRTTVGDMLLGVYDDSLYADELSLRGKQRQLEEVSREVENLVRVLSNVGQELDQNRLQRTMEQTQAEYGNVEQAIAAASANLNVEDRSMSRVTLNSLREAVAQRRQRWKTITEAMQRQILEIDDSRDFIEVLEKRIASLDQSVSVRSAFGELPLTHCPECLSPLVPVEDASLCPLCRQPLPENPQSAQVLRMQQELDLQLNESRSLLWQKERDLAVLRQNLPDVQRNLERAEAEFNNAVANVRTKRDETLDRLLVEKGVLEGRLDALANQLKAISVLETSRALKAFLTSEVQDISFRIKTKRDSQAARLVEARERVQAYALAFLKRDLPREPWFQNAQSVTFDFAKNTFAVDGRNQFSASSMVLLKNSVHFGILFSSLDAEFFRYPRLLICDNMEDKGMEPARSHNFQNIVAEISGSSDVEHQIIFTTSMISPELNDTDLCIGANYNLQQHTLDFPSTERATWTPPLT
jgi:HAMP domain-containing protein